MSDICRLALLLAVVGSLTGCVGYGVLYVNSVPTADITSGVTGQTLGSTPRVIHYKRMPFERTRLETVIFQAPGFQSQARIVLIDKWYSNWSDANTFQNELNVKLDPTDPADRTPNPRQPPQATLPSQ